MINVVTGLHERASELNLNFKNVRLIASQLPNFQSKIYNAQYVEL